MGWVVNATPRSLYPPEMTRYPLYRRLGRPQGLSERVLKISPPPGFDPRPAQLAASRYTDYAIPAHGGHTNAFFYFRRAPQQKLQTHRSLKAYCANLWWRWSVFFSFFQVMENRWKEIDRGKPKYSGKNLTQRHFVQCLTSYLIIIIHFRAIPRKSLRFILHNWRVLPEDDSMSVEICWSWSFSVLIVKLYITILCILLVSSYYQLMHRHE